MFYIDESGSIPKVRDTRYQHRYFVISFIHTENSRKVRNVYKRAIQKMKDKFPEYFVGISDPNEMKGSEMPPFMKLYLFDKLFQSTDIKISHMVVNTVDIEERFRKVPGRSFNYLIKTVMKSYPLSAADRDMLTIKIDNRNVKLEGLSELEGFLYNNLVLEDCLVDSVSVEYLDSKNERLIQIADIVAHNIYQRYRYKGIPFPRYSKISEDTSLVHPYTHEYLYDKLRQRFVLPYVFPISSQFIAEVATTYSL